MLYYFAIMCVNMDMFNKDLFPNEVCHITIQAHLYVMVRRLPNGFVYGYFLIFVNKIFHV